MRLLGIFCVLLLSACPGDWRKRDTIREHGLIAITAVDWYQTVDITKACRESNPIIGECGERVNMHLYFASVLVIQSIVARLLSPDYRGFMQGAWIGAEGATVWDNWATE